MSGDHNMHCSANQQKPICKDDLQVEICKREWVGLTGEDIAQLRREGAHSVSDKDFRAIEAKLKEKNHATRQYKNICDND